MKVRAKFKVDSITENSFGKTIDLSPVTYGSKENEAFYKQTPGGKLSLSTVNAEAAAQFKVGDEVYVDLTLATPADDSYSPPA